MMKGGLAAMAGLAGAAAAQDDPSLPFPAGRPASEAPRNFETYFPRISASRISEEDAPVIDADLSDPAWAEAAVIDEFYQVDPVEGAAPSQRTRAYVMFDQKTLYVGVYAYDTEPEGIRRSQMRRDPALEDDDGIRVLIDPFGSFRDSYFFALNPNGAKNDALIENNNAFQDQWNAIWRGKARVVADGWIAEFAIPFQSISFDASLEEWNFQIVRTIRRRNEEIRWSNIDQSRSRIDMTNPGRLAGVEDIKSGVGLEIQAYVTGSGSYDWERDDVDFSFNPSGNAFYKVTPSLTASLTVNTDFSDAPLDARQVNTGRFSLFFPETRDFFLQDAQVFEFGGRIFNNGPVNGLPFFSRNIGIVNNQPVDIIAGVKLSGKQGPFNIGAISARTGAADAIGVDGQFLSAARLSVPVLSESKLGVILTNGDPTGENDNTLAGADFQFKRSNVFGQGTLTADFAYIRTFDNSESDGMAAAHLGYRSQTWNGNIRLRDIGEDYAPRLGFANRTGVRRYDYNGWRAFRPNKPFLRYAEIGSYGGVITDSGDTRLDSYIGAWLFVQNEPGDQIYAEIERDYEDVREPFAIAGVLPVAAGEYRSNRHAINIDTSRSRWIGVGFDVGWSDAYDGELLEIGADVNFRPSKHFELSTGYNLVKFDLPGGALDIHIASINSTIAFMPDMTVKTEVQYDNISEAFTYFTRFIWEPVPEREIFLSFGHTAIIEDEEFPKRFRSLGSSLSLRLGQTFRF